MLLALTALPGLAYARPPDSSWIPGFYDDADFDDVVMLVASTSATVGPAVLVDLQPILPVVGRAPSGRERVKHSRPTSLDLARAPPAA